MKNKLALLCLLCVLCMLTGASGAPGDAFLFTEAQRDALDIRSYGMPSMAVIEDMVYTLWGSDVYVWQPGMDVPEQAASNLLYGHYPAYEDAQDAEGDDAAKFIHMLISDGETVFGFNTLNGYLYPLTFDGGLAEYGSPIELDWSEIEDISSSGMYMEIFNACYTNGFLYMLVRNDNDYENPILSRLRFVHRRYGTD